MGRRVEPTPVGPDGALSAEQLHSWRSAGFAVVSGVFDGALIAAAAAESEAEFALPTDEVQFAIF